MRFRQKTKLKANKDCQILSQDTAKVFLHSSKPQDKYTFFLKGTQLAQLTSEYGALYEQMSGIKAIINTKASRLHELEAKFKEARNAWKEIERVQGVETQIRELKHTLAWTSVQDVERVSHCALLTDSITETSVCLYRLWRSIFKEQAKRLLSSGSTKAWLRNIKPNSTRSKSELQRPKEQPSTRMQTTSTGNSTHCVFRSGTILSKCRLSTYAQSTRWTDVELTIRPQSEIRTMDGNVTRFKGQIRSLDEQIEGARKLLDGSGREKADRARAALARCDEEIRLATGKVAEARMEVNRLDGEITRARGELEGTRTEVMGARHHFEQAESRMASFENQRRNPMSAFGHNTEAILAAIDRDPNWRSKPVRLYLKNTFRS